MIEVQVREKCEVCNGEGSYVPQAWQEWDVGYKSWIAERSAAGDLQAFLGSVFGQYPVARPNEPEVAPCRICRTTGYVTRWVTLERFQAILRTEEVKA